MATVNMIAAAGTAFAAQITASRATPPATGATYIPDASGYVANVDVRDIDLMEKAGYQIAAKAHRVYTCYMPAAASQAVTVASVALSNGTLTIAAQPDVARQLQVIINPGTTAITAGNLAITYLANDGTAAQVDNFSMIMAAGGAAGTITATFKTTKGVEKLTAAVVTAMAGGTSPAIQVGTNAVIALPVDPGFASTQFSVNSEKKVTAVATTATQIPVDEAVGTVTAAGALIAPTTAPNAATGYVFTYTYAYPG
jgi:hypothetical protein